MEKADLGASGWARAGVGDWDPESPKFKVVDPPKAWSKVQSRAGRDTY